MFALGLALAAVCVVALLSGWLLGAPGRPKEKDAREPSEDAGDVA